jgi:hypothetical protein
MNNDRVDKDNVIDNNNDQLKSNDDDNNSITLVVEKERSSGTCIRGNSSMSVSCDVVDVEKLLRQQRQIIEEQQLALKRQQEQLESLVQKQKELMTIQQQSGGINNSTATTESIMATAPVSTPASAAVVTVSSKPLASRMELNPSRLKKNCTPTLLETVHEQQHLPLTIAAAPTTTTTTKTPEIKTTTISVPSGTAQTIQSIPSGKQQQLPITWLTLLSSAYPPHGGYSSSSTIQSLNPLSTVQNPDVPNSIFQPLSQQFHPMNSQISTEILRNITTTTTTAAGVIHPFHHQQQNNNEHVQKKRLGLLVSQIESSKHKQYRRQQQQLSSFVPIAPRPESIIDQPSSVQASVPYCKPQQSFISKQKALLSKISTTKTTISVITTTTSNTATAAKLWEAPKVTTPAVALVLPAAVFSSSSSSSSHSITGNKGLSKTPVSPPSSQQPLQSSKQKRLILTKENEQENNNFKKRRTNSATISDKGSDRRTTVNMPGFHHPIVNQINDTKDLASTSTSSTSSSSPAIETILGRSINFDILPPNPTMYELLRTWIRDDSSSSSLLHSSTMVSRCKRMPSLVELEDFQKYQQETLLHKNGETNDLGSRNMSSCTIKSKQQQSKTPNPYAVIESNQDVRIHDLNHRDNLSLPSKMMASTISIDKIEQDSLTFKGINDTDQIITVVDIEKLRMEMIQRGKDSRKLYRQEFLRKDHDAVQSLKRRGIRLE